MTDDDAQIDAIDIELRSSEAVARRCIILATIIRRLSIDAIPQEDSNEVAFDLREWLRTEGPWEDATQGERAFFSRPPGSCEPEGGPDTALVAESLVTIVWALGLLGSLVDDPLTRLARLIEEIPAPWEATAAWIAARRLRPEAEIATMRELQDIWNWRLEIEPDRRTAKGDGLVEIDRAIEEVTRDAITAELLLPGKQGGFAIDGVAVTSLAPDTIADLHTLTQERLMALNWVCGFGGDWDDVPIDV